MSFYSPLTPTFYDLIADHTPMQQRTKQLARIHQRTKSAFLHQRTEQDLKQRTEQDLNSMSCLEITRYYNNTFEERTGTSYSLAVSIFYYIFGCFGGDERRRLILEATKKESSKFSAHQDRPTLLYIPSPFFDRIIFLDTPSFSFGER